MLIHLTARVSSGGRPFRQHEAAQRFWRKLRDLFPDAIAAALMPDHVHLLLETADPAGARKSLACFLGAFSRHHAPGVHWSVAEPKLIPNLDHLRRQVRYVHLNPCRARHVDDPLRWLYSTHRGVIGAEVD